MADNKNKKPRARVTAGRGLSNEQIIDVQARWFFNHLMRIDTDEILKKAGIGRHNLEKLLSDDEIDSNIDRRKETLKNTDYILSPSEGKASEFVYEQLQTHLDSILTASINSKLYGYDVAEMIWDVKSSINSVVKIVSKPIEWLEPRNSGELHYFPNNHSRPIELTSQDDFYWRFLYQRHEPTFKNPKGKALLSRIYWLWYFKTNGWRFWSKFLERFGSPLLIGHSDAETEIEMQNFADSLLSSHSAGVVAVGKDEDVKAVESSGGGEAFKSYDDALNKRISKYLLGQTLTTGTDTGGTYGQGRVHQEQQEIIFNSDRKHAQKAVQRFINVICHANGFEPPVFYWVSNKGLQIERAERDEKLYRQGVRFTAEYYTDVYDIDKRYIKTVEGDNSTLSVNKSDSLASLAVTSNKYRQHSLAENTTTDKFIPRQIKMENSVSTTLANNRCPIDSTELKKTILESKDLNDLQANFFDLVDRDIQTFNAHIDNVMMLADVIGLAPDDGVV